MPDIVMPRLSDSMEEGTVVDWLKADGDEIEVGDELVEIETDKATMPYESDAAGVLVIRAAAGETLPIGAVIATVGAPENDGGDSASEASTESMPSRPDRIEPPGIGAADAAPITTASTSKTIGRVSASPVARRAAEKLGVSVQAVAGSGPYGRILKRDVVAYAEASPPEPASTARPVTKAAAAPIRPSVTATARIAADSELVPLSRIQQIVAQRMTEAKATIPDFSLEAEVNMSAALALREELKSMLDPAPSINDLIIKAVGYTLRRHPRVNSIYRGDHIEQYNQVNVGMAVATDEGLVVPTIRDADTQPLGLIAATSRDLVEHARAGTLKPSDLDGGTITVSNLGMLGIDRFAGVINPPQAAILCVGRAIPRPVQQETGEFVATPVLTITMVCDHRVLDGAVGARFLSDLRDAIERPLTMLA